MSDSFASILGQSNSVLILLPNNPNPDEVAASLSFHLAFAKVKSSSVNCQTNMTVEYNRLVGVDKITSELGNKNLVVRFPNYNADQIERVSYDIENQEFKLTVIPKPQFPPPNENQMSISYAGVAADTIILIGGEKVEDFPALASNELSGIKKVHVGIRIFKVAEGVLSFSTQSSSVSELAYSLLKEGGYDIDGDIATNLIQGIESATENLRSNTVTADTFQTLADLLRQGGKRMVEEKKNYPPGSIPGETPIKEVHAQPDENPPEDWLAPKIYKGTSVS